MSDQTTNGNSQYENIISWLKKDPVCNVEETIDDDNTVSIINTITASFKI